VKQLDALVQQWEDGLCAIQLPVSEAVNSSETVLNIFLKRTIPSETCSGNRRLIPAAVWF